MRKTFFIVGVFVHSIFFGQNDLSTTTNADGTYTVLGTQSLFKFDKYEEKDIKGTPYFEDDYAFATVSMDGKKIKDYAIKYNAYADEIVVAENDKTYALTKSESIAISLKNYTYKWSESKKGYFIFFNSDKDVSLVLKAKKKIKKAVEPKSGFGSYVPPSFVKEYIYFIKDKNNNLNEIRLKKKDILKILADKKKELEKYASSKKLSFNKEKDAIKIIDYYNSI